MKLLDKFWNWGHLEGSHNECTGLNCSMTPEGFAEEYGIKNAFIVSYGGNIQPPFDDLASRLSSLQEIKWSVLGDASTPLPEAELGNTEDIISVIDRAENITGGVVDDFFSEVRMKRFPPEVLSKIRARLNEKGLDFWCVLYAHELNDELEKYLDCFDGITFWVWHSKDIPNAQEYVEKMLSYAKEKPVMLGIYTYDYAAGAVKMDPELFREQLSLYAKYLKDKRIEGIVVCSSTIGDADLETNKILKDFLQSQGNEEI